MIIHKNGNILSTNTDIICQQVNCQGVMGSGLAMEIKKNFPGCYDGYIRFCNGKHPYDLHGQVNWVEARAKSVDRRSYIFANIFGQLNYGKSGVRYTSYEALKEGLMEVHALAKRYGLTVSIPYNIGCGLGGGDWEVVSEIIEKIFDDDVVCEIWKL